MNGKEFIRCEKRYGQKAGRAVRVEASHGKDSHARLHVGNRFTTVKHGEIRAGLLQAMLKDLDIAKEDF